MKTASLSYNIQWKRDGVVRGYDLQGDVTYTTLYQDKDGEVCSSLYGSSDISEFIRKAWEADGTVRVAIEFDLKPLERQKA